MGLIDRVTDEVGADQAGGLRREFRRDQDALPEFFAARIGKCQVRLDAGLAVPHREHAKTGRQIFHNGLGTQLVEAELVGERLRQCARAVDQEAAAMTGWGFGDQEIHHDLALRRQQRAEPAKARLDQVDIGGHKAIEKIARAFAADFDHAPIGKKCHFHTKFSGETLTPDVTQQRKPLKCR